MVIHKPDIYIVVPAFNEGQILHQILADLVETGYQIVVVDDGSADDTANLALQYPVHILRHPYNLGQGAALQTGITFALQQPECQIVVTFDADGQHDVGDIEMLVQELVATQSDVVLGSRFREGMLALNIPRIKLFSLKLAVLFTRFTTGLNITDTHNGFRAFTRTAAAKIEITQNRMSHASQILDQVAKLKLRYIELPVTIRYTDYSMAKGQSLWNSVNILWDSLVGRLK